MENRMLSQHLSLQECITSQTAIRRGIDNTPSAEVITNLKAIADNVFEPIRNHFGKPIRVSSGYRSVRLNKAIGGAATSQHCKGQALDLQGTNGLTNKQIFEWAKANLNFDQLIKEYPDKNGEPAWVHISYRSDGKNRKQVLYIGV